MTGWLNKFRISCQKRRPALFNLQVKAYIRCSTNHENSAMEIGRTNEACVSSVTVDEKASDMPDSKNQGSSSDTQTPFQSKNASVVRCLLKWRKYLILFFTPILLMPLPIAVPSTVRV